MATILEVDDIAVTGVGAICSGGRTMEEVWATVQSGVPAIDHPTGALADLPDAWLGEVPDEWLAPATDVAGPLGYDRTSRFAIHAALDALDAAGVDPSELPRDRTAIVLGRCQGTPRDVTGNPSPLHTTAGDLGRFFGVRGSSVVISTACAAGANAVGLARDKLLRGEADVALAGGVDILLAETFLGFQALQSLSTTPCAPYVRSDGLSLGEGAAILVLERAGAARARGATPMAHVLGYGLSADAHHATAPDPTARGPVAAVRRALADAGVDVDEIDYVNGHGTGTEANDQMERKAMIALFGERVGQVPISATKSFFGHTLGASGALEAAVSVLAIRDGVVPPTAVHRGAGTATGAPDRMAPLDIVPGSPRAAEIGVVLSSNYAFGGNNASLVLAHPRHPTSSPATRHTEPRAAITGFGPVGALGVGIEEWLEAFKAGRQPEPGRTEPVLDRPFIDPKRWRHLSELSRWCVAATHLACDDAGMPMGAGDRAATALLFATSHGPLQEAMQFSDSTATSAISVARFAGVTINAPAGAVTRAFGFKGPTTTLTVGSVSFHHALACAVDLIDAGHLERAVVLAADEVGPVLQRARALVDPTEFANGDCDPYATDRSGTRLSSGAVACVVESLDAARSRRARVYAEVHGISTYASPYSLSDLVLKPERSEAYATSVREAIARAGLEPGQIGYCASAATGHMGDPIEALGLSLALPTTTLVSAPSGHLGDCESATGALSVMAAAVACSDGRVPALPSTRALVPELALQPVRPGEKVQVDHAIATAFAWGGHYAAAVLSRPEVSA